MGFFSRADLLGHCILGADFFRPDLVNGQFVYDSHKQLKIVSVDGFRIQWMTIGEELQG